MTGSLPHLTTRCDNLAQGATMDYGHQPFWPELLQHVIEVRERSSPFLLPQRGSIVGPGRYIKRRVHVSIEIVIDGNHVVNGHSFTTTRHYRVTTGINHDRPGHIEVGPDSHSADRMAQSWTCHQIYRTDHERDIPQTELGQE